MSLATLAGSGILVSDWWIQTISTTRLAKLKALVDGCFVAASLARAFHTHTSPIQTAMRSRFGSSDLGACHFRWNVVPIRGAVKSAYTEASR